MEVWRDISGYEGLYQVSSIGRIKTLGHNRSKYYPKKEKIRKLGTSGAKGNDYASVILCKDGITRPFRVHRIVAKEFIPNPLNKPHINHKNGNRFDNSVENIEWSTRSENQIHAYKTGLQPSQKGIPKSIYKQ